jgi:hypothetical protein
MIFGSQHLPAESAAATFGRMYGQNSSGSFSSVRIYYGSNYPSVNNTGIETLLSSSIASSPLNIYTTKSDGSAFDGSEFQGVTIYRRTKNTSNSWDFVTSYAPYGGNIYSGDFSTYDYKLVIEDAS